ncbi:hypothetical protein HYFRA_00004794 [Hymenoscyphus fraxineus]|uniref:Uncharacterized protein n=1 Tax=Hymenoscyphus fraxineus TaxID=746836 RepID=A0A9N9KNE6_9HELO|nr:hypothetical protein HYFRA_00004794 [Hymenoscyphus fraxineus]
MAPFSGLSAWNAPAGADAMQRDKEWPADLRPQNKAMKASEKVEAATLVCQKPIRVSTRASCIFKAPAHIKCANVHMQIMVLVSLAPMTAAGGEVVH